MISVDDDGAVNFGLWFPLRNEIVVTDDTLQIISQCRYFVFFIKYGPFELKMVWTDYNIFST